MMYGAGERVLYGSHGVCQVVTVEERKVDRKMVAYLVLEPEGQPGARFLVPTHNEKAMAKISPVLTPESLEALLLSPQIRENLWEAVENLRKNLYRDILSGGDRVQLLRMLHTLYRHKAERLAEGKKFHQSDDNFLRDGEKLMASEIAWVLHMDVAQARDYLREKLQA